MSWGRTHPSELEPVKKLQFVSLILTKTVSGFLLVLQLSSNPWDEIERKFPINAKVRGKVVNSFHMVLLLNWKKVLKASFMLRKCRGPRELLSPAKF